MQFGIHKPQECVMIGDHLELDINGAKKCGLNTSFERLIDSINYNLQIKV